MEAWGCCLPGLWEGSQWFTKNSPKSWLCLPAGSCVPPRYGPRCLPALLHFLQLVLSTGVGLGAAAKVWEEALLLFLGLWLGPGERESLGSTGLSNL